MIEFMLVLGLFFGAFAIAFLLLILVAKGICVVGKTIRALGNKVLRAGNAVIAVADKISARATASAKSMLNVMTLGLYGFFSRRKQAAAAKAKQQAVAKVSMGSQEMKAVFIKLKELTEGFSGLEKGQEGLKQDIARLDRELANGSLFA